FADLRAEQAAELTRTTGILHEHRLSLALSFVLFTAYLLSLLFALGTHPHLYQGGETSQRRVSLRRPLITLGAATVGIAWMSELLVGAVEEASRALGLTQVFVGVIIV